MRERPALSWVRDENVALLTDLYELTMAASYHRRDMTAPATFDLFIRTLPARRNFLVVCGIEDALTYLQNLRFHDDALAYLASLDLFDDAFLDMLRDFTFTGDVWSIPEGELAFAQEPIVRVTAPLIEAQFVETFLLNCVTFQTMIASKAARVSIACAGRSFVDFSLRRDHGADAGLKAARAAYVGGAVATSNVLAGNVYRIPLSGTMAHSYVMAFPSEIDSFRAYAEDFGDRTILLIDTFDVTRGAHNAVTVAREMRDRGISIRGVRIDSGDLAEHAKNVRAILDAAGLDEIEIIASGDLDEYVIRDLVNAGAPIDSFGVGTQLGTSGDASSLGGAYKLVDDAGGPKMKLSTGKVTLPARKQVYRYSEDNTPVYDVIALDDEAVPDGRPLLEQTMAAGRRTGPVPDLAEIRERCIDRVASLPESLRSLESTDAGYRVDVSPKIQDLVASMEERHTARRP